MQGSADDNQNPGALLIRSSGIFFCAPTSRICARIDRAGIMQWHVWRRKWGKPLELSDKQVDSAAILIVTGRIDMATSEAFRERLLAMLAGGLPLVIDFSGVNYISSAGLRALMLASKQSRASGTKLAIAALQPVVLEIFQISRFDKLLQCHPTVDAALAAISSA
jgi:anti-anti-sigma factor